MGKLSVALGSVVALSGLAVSSVEAATISTDSTLYPNRLNVSDFGATGLGTDGWMIYDPFDVGNPNMSPSYVSSRDGLKNSGASSVQATSYATVTHAEVGAYPYWSDGSYAVMSVPGVASPVHVGIADEHPAVSGTSTTVLTVTLGANTPSSFVLGVLADNYTNYVGENMTAVTVESGISSASLDVRGNSPSPQNDFYFFLVSDAKAGDQIQVKATPVAGTDAALGGLTFDAVPEPAGLCLLAGSAGAMLLQRGRRGKRN